MQVLPNLGLIESAFRDDARLKKRVFDAISTLCQFLSLVLCLLADPQSVDSTPEHATLFEDIARYAEHIRGGTAPNGDAQANGEPSSKKRKVENDAARNGLVSKLGPDETQDKTIVFEAKDVSFQMPLRKKLNLEIARGCNDIFTIRATNAGTKTVEYEGLSSSIGKFFFAYGTVYC